MEYINRDDFEKRLVDSFFKVIKMVLQKNKAKRMSNYRDFFYLLYGNCLNCSIIDNARILKQNFEALGLDIYDKSLQQELIRLYEYSLKLKPEIMKLEPIHRRFKTNSNYARLFRGKERAEIDRLIDFYLENNKKSLSTINDIRKEFEDLLGVDILDIQDINSYIDGNNSKFIVELYKVWEYEYGFPQYKHFITEYDNFIMFEECKVELNIVNMIIRDKDGFMDNIDDILVGKDKNKKIEDLIAIAEDVLIKPFKEEKELKKVILKNGDAALFVKHYGCSNTLKLLHDNNIDRKINADMLYSSQKGVNCYGSVYDYDKAMKIFKDFLDDSVFMGAKIKINSKKQSEQVQKAVFEKGGSWDISSNKLKYTNKKYLFIDKNLRITFGDKELKESYISSFYPEMSAEDFVDKLKHFNKQTQKEIR